MKRFVRPRMATFTLRMPEGAIAPQDAAV